MTLKILALATVLFASSPEKIGSPLPPGFGDTEIKIVTFEIGGTDDLESFFKLLILHLNQAYGMIEGGAGGAKKHFQLGEISFHNKNLAAAAKHLDASLSALQTSLRIHLAKLDKRAGIGGVYSPRGGPALVGIRDDLNPVTNRAAVRLIQSIQGDTRMFIALSAMVIGGEDERAHQFIQISKQEILFGNPYLEELHDLARTLNPLRARKTLSAANKPGLCGECGHTNDPQSRFCSDCGARIDTRNLTRCSLCDAKNEKDANFCHQCGYSFEKD